MIWKHNFLIFLSLILFIGCYKVNGPEKPKNLIPKDKMVDILLEIRLMSSATGVNQSVLYNNGVSSHNYIYKKFGIDSTQLAKSNDYYAFYVDDYDEIYDRVQDTLQALKQKYDALRAEEEEERKRQDSINAIAVKDTLKLNANLDSLRLKNKRDSLKQSFKQKNEDQGLIPPVSDREIQD